MMKNLASVAHAYARRAYFLNDQDAALIGRNTGTVA